MKNKQLSFLFYLTVGFLMFSFSNYAQRSAKDHAAKASWIIGNWQGTYNSKPFYEAWRTVNDSTLINFTIEVKGADTIIKENGMLQFSNGTATFQGNDAAWKLLSLTDSKIELGNETLAYANRILWTHSRKDHWLTLIENPKGNLNYDLVRVEWIDGIVNRYIKAAGK